MEYDFSMSLSDLGKPDRQFARCRKLIMSAYGFGGGDPGLAKWIVRKPAGVPRKLHFSVLGRLFYIGFTPTPYQLVEDDDTPIAYEPQGDDSEDDYEDDDAPEAYDDPQGDDDEDDYEGDDAPETYDDPQGDYSADDYEDNDDAPETYDERQGDDSEDDGSYEGGDPVYDEHEHNEAAEVHFTGKMLDGTVFASSRQRNTPLTFKLIQEDMMPGFTLAVASMQPGEKAIFTIPPEFSSTMPDCCASIPWNIPPNQTLRFDIELISLITDILDDQGILRKTVKFGRANYHPCDSDEVFVSYNACLMDGTLVSKSEGVEFILNEGFFCPAFAYAVKTMTEGEEVVLIIKPEYGFGERGRSSIGNENAIPPDATLHVNLQLISWKTVSHIGENEDILKKAPFQANKLGPYSHIRNHAVVKARLEGKLQDGTVFERRGHDGEGPFQFILDEGHVIDGLEECVMTMEVGEVASFTIPPQRAFGAVGSNQYHLAAIPPNSTVIYEIEILSVINEYHSAMTLDEMIESARKKKKEGDHLFNSGFFLRAYRRYFKASQILRSRTPEPDGDIKQMLISLALSGAECAMQLQRYKQASDCMNEVRFCTEKRDREGFRKFLPKYKVLEYDPKNVEALQLVAQPLPEDSVQVNKFAMHRGSLSWTCPLREATIWIKGPFIMKLKKGHKPSGRMISVPPSSNAAAGQSQATQSTRSAGSGSSQSQATQSTHSAGSGSQSSGNNAKKKKSGLSSYFRFSSSSG